MNRDIALGLFIGVLVTCVVLVAFAVADPTPFTELYR